MRCLCHIRQRDRESRRRLSRNSFPRDERNGNVTAEKREQVLAVIERLTGSRPAPRSGSRVSSIGVILPKDPAATPTPSSRNSASSPPGCRTAGICSSCRRIRSRRNSNRDGCGANLPNPPLRPRRRLPRTGRRPDATAPHLAQQPPLRRLRPHHPHGK